MHEKGKHDIALSVTMVLKTFSISIVHKNVVNDEICKQKLSNVKDTKKYSIAIKHKLSSAIVLTKDANCNDALKC